MAEIFKPLLCVIRDTLEFVFSLRNFHSPIYEGINRPQVEVKEDLDLLINPIMICRSEYEKIEVEPSINSVRINILFKKYTDLEGLLSDIYTNFLMNSADKINILRKKPKENYDISFLITNYHLEYYKKEKIIDFIVEFMQFFESEMNEMKLIVNSQCRLASNYLMEQVKP